MIRLEEKDSIKEYWETLEFHSLDRLYRATLQRQSMTLDYNSMKFLLSQHLLHCSKPDIQYPLK